MLVITRTRHETITIGGEISIEIIEVMGGKVRLAIQAPKEIRIDHPSKLQNQHQQKKAKIERRYRFPSS